MKELEDSFEDAKKKAEQSHAKLSKELKTTDLIEMRLIGRKGYGEQAVAHIRECSQVQQGNIDKFHKEVICMVVLFLDNNKVVTEANSEQFAQHTKTLEDRTETLDTEYKRYVREDLAEFAKYRG